MQTSPRILFMGTPDFACHALDAMIKAGYHVEAVYTQPSRPAGRGKKTQLTPVHQYAMAHGIEVVTPTSLKDAEIQQQLIEKKPDVVVVAAYGLMIPQALLDYCPFINIHASLLPRWRGAAPIQRAILAGDATSGITIMNMEAGLDTGAMLLKEEIPLDATMTAGKLHDSLAQMGGRLCVEVLSDLDAYLKKAETQDDSKACYAKKIDKAEAKIDFYQNVEDIDRQVRAFNPYPGAWFELKGEKIKLFEVAFKKIAHTHTCGDVIDNNVTIAAKDGVIIPILIQREGKKIMPVEEFLKGYKV